MKPYLLIFVLLAACARESPQLVVAGPTMGTRYSVKVVNAPMGVDEPALRAAIDEVLERVDRSMSGYRSDSEIARFNDSTSTRWFEVSAELAIVVQAALDVSRSSQGAFDVTVTPLVAAWGFGPAGEPSVLPDDAELRRLAQRVGYQRLHARASPPALRKDIPELSVDLNGIAPGFAVDALAARLQSMGIDDFMIEIGGEVRARGVSARGEPWRIAVERPVDAQPEPYAIVALKDAAVATSGEYRHYYERDGRRYSHTIDPRTRRPLQHAPASVVVVAPSAMHADAWATAFNVLGAREGFELATKLQMPVMFIGAREGGFHSLTTPEFRPYLADDPAS